MSALQLPQKCSACAGAEGVDGTEQRLAEEALPVPDEQQRATATLDGDRGRGTKRQFTGRGPRGLDRRRLELIELAADLLELATERLAFK